MKVRIFCLIFCGFLSACGGSARIGPVSGADGVVSSRVQVVDNSTLPPPSRADLLQENRPYLIGPFDKLVIDVFGIPELSQKEFQTDAAGRISFPLAGDIEAAGKTPAELELEVEQRLRRGFIRNPQVTVNLRETVSRVITIDGEVREPGLYPVIGRMTLMRAIATAKGVGEFAKKDHVVVFRTVGGQRLAALYDLKAIRNGIYDDPELFANDIVVVGDSQARRVFKDFIQLVPLLTTPLIVALQ